MHQRDVLPRQRGGLGRPLDRNHTIEAPLGRQGQRDAPGPGSDVGCQAALRMSQHQIHEPLGLGPRNERARIDREIERPESDASRRVRERHAAFQLSQRALNSLDHFWRLRFVTAQPGLAGRHARHGRPHRRC